jgi:hypothetical protein
MISAKAATALLTSSLKEPPPLSKLADEFMQDLFNVLEREITRLCKSGESSLSFNFGKDRRDWSKYGLSEEQILNTLSSELVKAGYTFSVSDELAKADITITESGSVSHRNEYWYSVEVFWPEA